MKLHTENNEYSFHNKVFHPCLSQNFNRGSEVVLGYFLNIFVGIRYRSLTHVKYMHTGKETDFSKIILYFFTYLRSLPEGCDTFWAWKKSGFFSLLLFNQ